jgi:hypothetical protein
MAPWNPIVTAPKSGGASDPPLDYGPEILVRDASNQSRARWRTAIRRADANGTNLSRPGRWEAPWGGPLPFMPTEWR